MTKLTDGKLSTAAHPPASRQVLVSAEYTIPGMACMRQRLVSHLSHTAMTLNGANKRVLAVSPLARAGRVQPISLCVEVLLSTVDTCSDKHLPSRMPLTTPCQLWPMNMLPECMPWATLINGSARLRSEESCTEGAPS